MLTDAFNVITELIPTSDDDNVLQERISLSSNYMTATDILSQITDIFNTSTTVETSRSDGDNYPDILFEFDPDGNRIVVN